MKSKSKAYAPRKMRVNWKRGACMPPKWLALLDVKAKEAAAADVDEQGFSRVSLDAFLNAQTWIDPTHEPRARDRYRPFFAQVAA